MAYPDSNRFQEPTKLWNKWYITILLLSMVNHVASQLITPVVSKYAMSIGATMATAGTIAGLMSLAPCLPDLLRDFPVIELTRS